MFAMMMTVQVAKADDNVYVFGLPLGFTTYNEFTKVLEEKGFTYFTSAGDRILYKGMYNGREILVYYVVNNYGCLEGVVITVEELQQNKAKQLFNDLDASTTNKYPTFYKRKVEENGRIESMFVGKSNFISIYIEPDLSTYTLNYVCSVNKNNTNEDKEVSDDTFVPDFETEVDSTLYPKDMNSLNVEWSVSDEFKTKSGKTGSYWFPTMRIACCADGKFILSILRPASNGYFKVSEGDDCYIRLENDSIVTLKLNTEYSPWNYEREGYYVGSVYMKTRYFTQTFYDIEDILQLSNSNIIKIRWIEDNKPYDIEYTDKKWAKTFNKSFHDAIQQAYKKQKEKSAFNEDKLSGF